MRKVSATGLVVLGMLVGWLGWFCFFWFFGCLFCGFCFALYDWGDLVLYLFACLNFFLFLGFIFEGWFGFFLVCGWVFNCCWLDGWFGFFLIRLGF